MVQLVKKKKSVKKEQALSLFKSATFGFARYHLLSRGPKIAITIPDIGSALKAGRQENSP